MSNSTLTCTKKRFAVVAVMTVVFLGILILPNWSSIAYTITSAAYADIPKSFDGKQYDKTVAITPEALIGKLNYTDIQNVSASIKYKFSDQSVNSTIHQIRVELGYDFRKNETCEKRTPSCIIIGVKKSGTRELIDFMNLHPNIRIKNNPYEIGYFTGMHYSRKPKGSEWYRNNMPCSFKNQITVTKYPWYFSSPQAAERMYAFNQTLKLIVLVREPVKRLISGYTFRNKHWTLPIERKVLNENGMIQLNYEEIKLSTYDKALMTYLKYFSLDQILFIESNELKTDPVMVLRRVETFLGLKHVISDRTFVYNPVKQFVCVGFHETAFCYGDERGRISQPIVKNSTLERLRSYFLPHNEKFFKIIGKRYNW